MKLAISNINIVANLTELKAIITTGLNGNEFRYVSSLKESVVFWQKSGEYQPNDYDVDTNLGGWDVDDVGCNSIMEEVADDYDFATNGKTEVLISNIPANSRFKKPFINSTDHDYRIKGFHKKETYDTKGDISVLEFYNDYDEVEGTHDKLAVKEIRTYTRSTITGLPEKRVTDITFYNNDGTVFAEKLGIEKHYSAKKGFESNKRARQNLIDNASMYLFATLMANNLGDAALTETQVDDFETLTDSAQSKYVKSNTTPLIDILSTCTIDDGNVNYRAYMTITMKATLLTILDIDYSV